MSNRLHITDNDKDRIIVTLDGKGLRGWQYANANERRVGMMCAYEYIEGWRMAIMNPEHDWPSNRASGISIAQMILDQFVVLRREDVSTSTSIDHRGTGV